MEHVACMRGIQLWLAERDRQRDAVQVAVDSSLQQLQEAADMRQSAEHHLEQAAPTVREAESALSSISRPDLAEFRGHIRGLAVPPLGLMKLCEAIFLLLRIPLRGENATARWQIVRTTLLKESNFLSRLLTYDKDKMDDETMRRLEPFVSSGDWSPERFRSNGKVAVALCTWVRAMSLHHNVFERIRPKLAAVRRIEARLEVRNAVVESRKRQVDAVEECLDMLRTELGNYAPLVHKAPGKLLSPKILAKEHLGTLEPSKATSMNEYDSALWPAYASANC